jgi:hypothetical protein
MGARLQRGENHGRPVERETHGRPDRDCAVLAGHTVNNGHLDGNHFTERQEGWVPLFPTPPHPEYTSGHASNSAAMSFTLGLLFGDAPGVAVLATSPTNPSFPRQWTRFSEGVDEVIDARIYSGIHFRSADEVGARIGRQVARFVFTHALR